MTDYASQLGGADYGQRNAKHLLKSLSSGDYNNVMGSYLSPIKDQYAVNERENSRDLAMGANSFLAGSQPGLMATIGNESRLKNQEGLGMAMASAVPQLYGQAQGAFNAGRQRQLGEEGIRSGLLQAASQGNIAGHQLVQGPSIFDSIMKGVGAAGGLASGLGGLGFKPFTPTKP